MLQYSLTASDGVDGRLPDGPWRMTHQIDNRSAQNARLLGLLPASSSDQRHDAPRGASGSPLRSSSRCSAPVSIS